MVANCNDENFNRNRYSIDMHIIAGNCCMPFLIQILIQRTRVSDYFLHMQYRNIIYLVDTYTIPNTPNSSNHSVVYKIENKQKNITKNQIAYGFSRLATKKIALLACCGYQEIMFVCTFCNSLRRAKFISNNVKCIHFCA